jgi:GT2 family glycosyltransferase
VATSLTAGVVIATRGRPSEVKACLRALEADESKRAFAVVLVDDGSVPPIVREASERYPVRTIRTLGIGPGQARNAGVAATDADVILFTDDDVIVDPRWISSALGFLETHPGHAGVEGIVRSRRWDPLYESSVQTSSPGHFWTCNIAYRRSALLAVGGFAVGFPAAHCEDRDLGLRVASEVGPIGFEPEMTVTHTPRALTTQQMIRRGRLVASDIELERRHPGVFPKGRIPLSGRSMAPVRLAHRWMLNARPGSEYQINTPRRAARFALVAIGQVAVAAWAAARADSSRSWRFEAEVEAAPRTDA